ncbi:DUF6531 domain-containing protein [Catenulispora rubra]|uniref:DUF6531 domain-containing protein n=1 Tax=Catenulispora rubra TaxID=280293 RepID=UPI001891F4AD|nr:DUF6531 domain-containing protein [Catenulispora rubra]
MSIDAGGISVSGGGAASEPVSPPDAPASAPAAAETVSSPYASEVLSTISDNGAEPPEPPGVGVAETGVVADNGRAGLDAVMADAVTARLAEADTTEQDTDVSAGPVSDSFTFAEPGTDDKDDNVLVAANDFVPETTSGSDAGADSFEAPDNPAPVDSGENAGPDGPPDGADSADQPYAVDPDVPVPVVAAGEPETASPADQKAAPSDSGADLPGRDAETTDAQSPEDVAADQSSSHHLHGGNETSETHHHERAGIADESEMYPEAIPVPLVNVQAADTGSPISPTEEPEYVGGDTLAQVHEENVESGPAVEIRSETPDDHGDDEVSTSSPDENPDPDAGRTEEAEPRESETPRPDEAAAQAVIPTPDEIVGDPVNVITGEAYLDLTDLVLPGVLPLVLSRTHASGYRFGRWFGPTWASTVDQRVIVDAEGIHYLVANGSVLHYPIPLDGLAVLPTEGERRPLTWMGGQGEILIENPWDGTTLHFAATDADGADRAQTAIRPISALTDRNGNRCDFLYDGRGEPTEIRHSGGYRVLIDTASTSKGTRISGLRLDDGTAAGVFVVAFGYDYRGDLTQTIDSRRRPLTFDYDEVGRITGWTDANGQALRYRFNDQGRIVATAGTGGHQNARLFYDLDARTTTVTDSLGLDTVYHWTRSGVHKIVDPLGGVRLIERDRYRRLLSFTDQLGRTSRLIRDEHGDVRRIELPDGTAERFDYNQLHQPVQITAADGAVRRFAYDEHGNLFTVTDPAGAITTRVFNRTGALTGVTDALGGHVSIQPDAAGLPTAVTDAAGRLSTIVRDPFGRQMAFTDPAGGTSRAAYTPEGRLLTSVTPSGATNSWSYDPAGNPVEHRSPTGAVTRTEYGPGDRVTARTEPDGARYEFGYDTELRLTAVTNPQGRQWVYTYDPAGRLIAERDFDGRQITYTLDAAGQLISRTDAGGDVLTYSRDLLGRLTGVTDQWGDTTTYEYDTVGRLIRATNGVSVLEYQRSVTGRVLSEIVDGRTITYAYDALGRRTSRTTPAGITSTWTYNPDSSPATWTDTTAQITFGYDDAGHETIRQFGSEVTLAWTWDADRRLQALSLTAAATGTEPILERTYDYRADGIPTSITDSRYGDRHFDVDLVGRITAIRANTWTGTYAYDSTGNLIHSATPHTPETNGTRTRVGTSLRSAGRTTYSHDDKGRLTRTTRRTLDGRRRVTTYVWNTRDQLTTVTLSDGTTWHYTYDPLGRRIGKWAEVEDRRGNQASFSWDHTRLTEQTINDSQTLTWDYTPGTYRPLAQIRTTANGHSTNEPVAGTTNLVVTDIVGTPTDLIALDGTTTWHHDTTAWGTALAGDEDSDVGCPLRFPGQYRDRETGFHYNFNRYYDPETAAYISADPIGMAGGFNPKSYSPNPNVDSDPLGLQPGNSPDSAHETDSDVRGIDNIEDGGFLYHVIDSARGPVELMASVSIADSEVILSDIAVYGQGGMVRGSLGMEGTAMMMREIRRVFLPLLSEQGYGGQKLRIAGVRLSGPVGHKPDLVFPIPTRSRGDQLD